MGSGVSQRDSSQTSAGLDVDDEGAHSSFSTSVDDEVVRCRTEAIDILRDDYPGVKDGLLSLEVFMRRKSRKAVYELRDFLAHFAKIFEDEISPADARHNLSECRTHLRRCAVEPLEYKAEKGFVRLDRLSRWFGWVVWRAPQTKKDFHRTMVEIKKLIAAGRHVKAEGRAADSFRNAFELVEDLKADVGPVRYIIRAIIAAVVIFLVGLLSEAGRSSYLQWKAACKSSRPAIERETLTVPHRVREGTLPYPEKSEEKIQN